MGIFHNLLRVTSVHKFTALMDCDKSGKLNREKKDIKIEIDGERIFGTAYPMLIKSGPGDMIYGWGIYNLLDKNLTADERLILLNKIKYGLKKGNLYSVKFHGRIKRKLTAKGYVEYYLLEK